MFALTNRSLTDFPYALDMLEAQIVREAYCSKCRNSPAKIHSRDSSIEPIRNRQGQIPLHHLAKWRISSREIAARSHRA